MPKKPRDVFKVPGKPRAGKSSARGAAFEPGARPPAAAPAAAAAAAGRDLPRPAKTRYPIDLETFLALQARAERVRVPAKKTARVVPDAARKAEPARRATVAPSAVPAFAGPAAAPQAVGNFQGIADTSWYPPDCTLAAGPQHVMLSVNSSVAIYTRTGGVAQAATTLDAWFGNVISNAKIFDPRLLYDQHVDRWLLLAVALPLQEDLHESYFLLSISQTSDPTGAWWNYKPDAMKDGGTATDNWADYPALGMDSHAYYLTANMFKFGGNFQYAKLRVLNKTPLLSGGSLTWWDIVRLKNGDGSLAFAVQPCQTYGAPQNEYLVNSYFTASATQKQLTLWTVSNPTGTPSASGRTVTTAPFGQPPKADQQGGPEGLDAGDVRVLNAVFRGGSVWCALTTVHNWGEAVNRAAVHWFQLNATSGALVQQGVYGAKGSHYFYPAVMPDTNGNLTVVFCRCGPSEYASVYYAGRQAADPVGQLQSSTLLKAGLGYYERIAPNDPYRRNRWGDYAGIDVDPADQRAIWLYSMYAEAGNHWGTWVGATRFS
jgi:hypothetical protein